MATSVPPQSVETNNGTTNEDVEDVRYRFVLPFDVVTSSPGTQIDTPPISTVKVVEKNATDLCHFKAFRSALSDFIYRISDVYINATERSVETNDEYIREMMCQSAAGGEHNSLLEEYRQIRSNLKKFRFTSSCEESVHSVTLDTEETTDSNPCTKNIRVDDWYLDPSVIGARVEEISLCTLLSPNFPMSPFFSMLKLLSYHIGYNIPLFTRIIKLISSYVQLMEWKKRWNKVSAKKSSSISHHQDEEMKQQSDQSLNDDEIPSDIVNYVSSCILPGLVVAGCNPHLTSLVWSGILCYFPYYCRYQMYDYWKSFSGDSVDQFCGKAPASILSTTCTNFVAADVYHEECKSLYAAKQQLKRLTKDNVKLIGRQIAKSCHHTPLTVLAHLLSQLESYENLIPYVVEALKYTTDLTRDCVSYSILVLLYNNHSKNISSPLGNKKRYKLKAGDTHYSQWYTSITKFMGSFYRKYPTTELKGIFSFLLNRLTPHGVVSDCDEEDGSVDLLVLKDLLNKMGGCETTLEISRSQLSLNSVDGGGLTGGRILRVEILSASSSVIAARGSGEGGNAAMKTGGGSGSAVAKTAAGIGREVVNKKAIKILREELIESRTAIPLLLFIAQCKSRVIYESGANNIKDVEFFKSESEGTELALTKAQRKKRVYNYEDDGSGSSVDASLKLISHLYDTCQDVLMQYTEFLMNSSTSGLYSSSSADLVPIDGLSDNSQLLTLFRLMPSLHSLLYSYELSISVAFQLVRPLLRLSLLYHLGKKKLNADSSATDTENLSGAQRQFIALLEQWNPLGGNIMKTITEYHANHDMWGKISPELYIMFWCCNKSDLVVPSTRYESEIRKLKERHDDMNSRMNKLIALGKAQPNITISSNGYSNFSVTPKLSEAELETNRSNIKLLKQEIKRCVSTLNDLKTEYSQQKASSDLITEYIQKCAADNKYFRQMSGDINENSISEVLVQYCIYDRVRMSPMDASYCSQFFFTLHNFNTPNFVTIALIDRIIHTIPPLIFCGTDYEIAFIGLFLADIIETVNMWCYSSASMNGGNNQNISSDAKLFDAQVASHPIGFSNNKKKGVCDLKEEDDVMEINADNDLEEGSSESEPNKKKRKSSSPSTSNKEICSSVISHEDFMLLYKGWHRRITDVILAGLSTANSKEYMYRRCALVLVAKLGTCNTVVVDDIDVSGKEKTDVPPTKRSRQATKTKSSMVTCFPLLAKEGGLELLDRIVKVEEEEKKKGREDLSMMAKGVYAILRRQSITSRWIGFNPPVPSVQPSTMSSGDLPALSSTDRTLQTRGNKVSPASTPTSMSVVKMQADKSSREAGEEDEESLPQPPPPSGSSSSVSNIESGGGRRGGQTTLPNRNSRGSLSSAPHPTNNKKGDRADNRGGNYTYNGRGAPSSAPLPSANAQSSGGSNNANRRRDSIDGRYRDDHSGNISGSVLGRSSRSSSNHNLNSDLTTPKDGDKSGHHKNNSVPNDGDKSGHHKNNSVPNDGDKSGHHKNNSVPNDGDKSGHHKNNSVPNDGDTSGHNKSNNSVPNDGDKSGHNKNNSAPNDGDKSGHNKNNSVPNDGDTSGHNKNNNSSRKNTSSGSSQKSECPSNTKKASEEMELRNKLLKSLNNSKDKDTKDKGNVTQKDEKTSVVGNEKSRSSQQQPSSVRPSSTSGGGGGGGGMNNRNRGSDDRYDGNIANNGNNRNTGNNAGNNYSNNNHKRPYDDVHSSEIPGANSNNNSTTANPSPIQYQQGGGIRSVNPSAASSLPPNKRSRGNSKNNAIDNGGNNDNAYHRRDTATPQMIPNNDNTHANDAKDKNNRNNYQYDAAGGNVPRNNNAAHGRNYNNDNNNNRNRRGGSYNNDNRR